VDYLSEGDSFKNDEVYTASTFSIQNTEPEVSPVFN
jgi:hypothetical protein